MEQICNLASRIIFPKLLTISIATDLIAQIQAYLHNALGYPTPPIVIVTGFSAGDVTAHFNIYIVNGTRSDYEEVAFINNILARFLNSTYGIVDPSAAVTQSTGE